MKLLLPKWETKWLLWNSGMQWKGRRAKMGGTAFREHGSVSTQWRHSHFFQGTESPAHPCTLHGMWEKPVSAAKVTPGKNTSKSDKKRKCKTFLRIQIWWFSELTNEAEDILKGWFVSSVFILFGSKKTQGCPQSFWVHVWSDFLIFIYAQFHPGSWITSTILKCTQKAENIVSIEKDCINFNNSPFFSVSS